MGNSGSVFKSSSSKRNSKTGEQSKTVSLNHEEFDEKEKSYDDKPKQDHQAYLNNMFQLKSLFKKLDPSVLNQRGKMQGELKVSYKFVADQSLLLAKVILAQDLSPKDLRGESADPYVKVELLVDNKAQNPEGRLNATTVKKNTVNPIYNEIFSFELKEELLQKAKLRFSVWCYDEMNSDDFIGEAFVSINQLSDDQQTSTDQPSQPQIAWLQLKPQTDLQIGGEVYVKLEHKLPQNLSVSVARAEGLSKVTSPQNKPYVKLYIPGVPYVHKTSPPHADDQSDDSTQRDPVWQQTFEFPILREELRDRDLVLVITDADDDSAYYGEVHISLGDVLARNWKEPLSYPVRDLRSSVASASRWAKTALRDEFQQALQAHASYKSPDFLFSRPMAGADDQAISVRVPKASVASRLRLLNGVLVH